MKHNCKLLSVSIRLVFCFTLMLSIFSLSSYAQDIPKQCRKIKKEVDVMDGTVSISSNIPMSLLGVRKYVENGQTRTYLTLKSVGYTLNFGEKGVIVLLEDGSKIERPSASIDCDSATSGWMYSAWITLSDDEIEKLKTTKIAQWRLYIYDSKPTSKQAEKLMIQLGCIDDMQ